MESNRPKVYRDPIHGQINYKRCDLNLKANDFFNSNKELKDPDGLLSWSVRKLINCPEFQRLRHIRQNGLTNLVFQGAEHSRFSHSMGVCYLAQEMYERILRNTGASLDFVEYKLATTVAALLHDTGHGPFSHTLEEVMRSVKIPFDHELMTQRIIEEDETEIHKVLKEIDEQFPSRIVPFINKIRRQADHWTYKLVSSQLDADRLDYLLRDAQCAGIRGHGFDLPRLLDMLHHYDEKAIAVDRHAIEAVEAYLLMLEQMYRAVYFHPTVRAATKLLQAVLSRAIYLYKEFNDFNLFPDGVSGKNPLRTLIDEGQEKISLSEYIRLDEHQIWVLISDWQHYSQDDILRDLSKRLMQRKLFRAVEVTQNVSWANLSKENQKLENIKNLVIEKLSHLKLNSNDVDKYYLFYDYPVRDSYKRYDFGLEEGSYDSIWMIGDNKKPCQIERDDSNSMILAALQNQNNLRYKINLLIFPDEITKNEIFQELNP